jgi:primosomal protein N' (replication factor Y)
LKPLNTVLPAPPLPEVSRRFVEWVAQYTVQPQGAVLRMVMSVPEALSAGSPKRVLRLATPRSEMKLSPARQRVLAVLADGSPRSSSELARAAGCGTSVVRHLLAAGVLESIEIAPIPQLPDGRLAGRALSGPQIAAATALRSRIGNGFSVELLDGVPGAGKTDVYFEAIAEALSCELQVLVLLPEISLGIQWRARFAARFGAPPREWHSDLGRADRRHTWRAVAEGNEPVIVGTRSALFLPFPRLGLIVVDEEHDSSFKQEDGVAYHARDMAVVRARLGSIPCILVSATPSLETVFNVRSRRYNGHTLQDRATGSAPPRTEIVDLRLDRPPKDCFVAPALRRAVQETIAAGRQALLFLNRRGYAPLTLCRSCGYRLRCNSCSAWLVEHRLLGLLQCHYCGYRRRLPRACPGCGAVDGLVACGPGVERLAEEVAAFVPGARTVLATSDTCSSPAAAEALMRSIERHEVDLIIGTQLMSKGHHFPLLTLVGVVDADAGLAGGDLRAAERTFQLLYQVGGRAGREPADERNLGRVLLQTAVPENPVIAALVCGDRARFLEAEAADRRESGLPPFGRLAALIISARDEAQAESAARSLALAAPPSDGLRILGPAPPPLALLRGRHRRRLLAIATRDFALSPWIRNWVARVPLSSTVRMQIDMDPQSFL